MNAVQALVLDAALAAAALLLALSTRPWRALPPAGPPWPWLACWALLPLLWSVDRLSAVPFVQPLSGACLLLMMAGWPLAVPGIFSAALLLALLTQDAAWALHRGVWLGLVPATLALAFGAALRRWLPHQLFIYILGRGFIGTVLAGSLAGLASALLHGVPPPLRLEDVALARFLAAWADGFMTGMFVAIFVAFRPEWLATYADRIWLQPPS